MISRFNQTKFKWARPNFHEPDPEGERLKIPGRMTLIQVKYVKETLTRVGCACEMSFGPLLVFDRIICTRPFGQNGCVDCIHLDEKYSKSGQLI